MVIDASKYCPLPGVTSWKCERCQWIRERGCCFNGMTKTEMRHLQSLYGKRVQNETKKITAEYRIAEANNNLEFWETIYSANAVKRIEEE